MEIERRKKFYDEEEIFKIGKINLEKGVTTLVGCNGYGKSTTLIAIKEHLEKNKIDFMEYKQIGKDNINYIREDSLFSNNKESLKLLSTSMCSSEGENIILSFGEFSRKIGFKVRKLKNSDKNDLFILIDSLDSGLSIDNITELKEFFNLIIDDADSIGINVYIINSVNSYEFTIGSKCLDVYTGKYKEFKNYDDYKNFILKCHKIKEKRYEK